MCGVKSQTYVAKRDGICPYFQLSYELEGINAILSPEIIAVIAGAVAIFAIVLIVLLILYRRKSTRHQRELRKLKQAMDTIEMKVAAECKGARVFHYLSTRLSSLYQTISFIFRGICRIANLDG